MGELFHIEGDTAITVVMSTVGIYLVFIALVRVTGPRSLTGTSSFDVACVVAFGAVIGRTPLLAEPTLMIGALALATFFVLQGTLGWLRRFSFLDRLVNGAGPIVLVRDGVMQAERLRPAHVTEDDLRQALRHAGLRSPGDAAYVVLERNGTLSVIVAGQSLDPWLVADLDSSIR